MSYLRWEHRPALRRPILIAAFEGWTDAGEAASTAVQYLHRQLGGRTFATIDPEDFYDFTVARPHVRIDDDFARHIDWPTPSFSAVSVSAHHPSDASPVRDLVLLSAVEPALKWRTYCHELLTVCSETGVDMVLTLGALLGEIPHTRPVRVSGSSTHSELITSMRLQRSRYQGPVGISSVLHAACEKAGIRSASLWATTPHYLSQTPSPKAALALVQRVAQVVGTRVDTAELEIASAAYERQVDEMLAGEDDVVDYVRRLEQEASESDSPIADGDDVPPLQLPASPDALAAEVERYLREQG